MTTEKADQARAEMVAMLREALVVFVRTSSALVDAGHALGVAILHLQDTGQGDWQAPGTSQKAIPRASDEAQGTARLRREPSPRRPRNWPRLFTG